MSLPCVLVVEDNPTTRKLFRVALEAEGYRVLEAGDGRQALALAKSEAPDMVLTDLVLPDIDGLALAQELRSLPFGAALPMVAVSGFRRLLDKACLEPDAFNDFLLKPVDLTQLLEVVARFVAKPRAPEASASVRPRTVLLVDDDPVQLKLTRVRLELEGFRVIATMDGVAALELAQASKPDVVLCDVLMPGKDGFELCLAIRSDLELAQVPVVLVSAHFGGTRDAELARQVGASQFVLRTPDVQGIVSALNAALASGPGAVLAEDFPHAEHAERISAQLKRQARANAGWAERSALQAAQLTILAGIGKTLSRADEAESSFGDVLATCLDTGGISRGALFRFDLREPVVCTHSIGFASAQSAELDGAFGFPQLLESARTGHVVAPSASLSEAELASFLTAAGASAAVLVPLVAERSCIGALLLASTSTEMGEQDLLAFGRAIATHTAQALAMSSSMARLRTTSKASRILASSLDLQNTLAAFGTLATEGMADVCEVHLAGEAPAIFSAPGVQTPPAPGVGASHTFVATLTAHGHALGTVTMMRGRNRRPFQEFDRMFAEDLSQRAAIAIDNAQLYQAAQDASRLKDEFLATLSHELRTPLNAILGWARMLSGGLEPAKHADAIRVIERNAVAQARLIEDLLDTASMVSNKARLTLRLTDAAKVIDASIDSVRPLLEQKKVRLQRTGAEATLQLLADPDRLQQIVGNLLNNAVKFTPAGGKIRLDTSISSSELVLRLSDDGQGIEPRFLPHVFERFKQADGSSTRAHGGLGLGLSIAHHLVQLHHGSISVHSDGIGRGATFTVRIPTGDARRSLMPLPVVANRSDASAAPGKSSPSEPKDGGDRLNDLVVLVVDDEEDSRELAAEVLIRSGARATMAASSKEAYGVFLRSPPDLLVSDIGMPGEDGVALIQKVRALPKAKGGGIPAIALSGYVATQDRSRAVSAGYTLHLAKPFDPEELVRIAANLTNGKRLSAG